VWVLASAGVVATWHSVPVPPARVAASVRDHTARLIRAPGTHRLSRFLVEELVHPHWFDLTAARRDLGFAPAVGIAAGLAELAASGTGAVAEVTDLPTSPSVP
jgi:nucleoside-diphosphate-sugar epimerase